MTFGEQELCSTAIDKNAILGYSIILNHPFVDGNKRTGHSALEVTLVLNGFELTASSDEQEQVVLSVAAGETKRADFSEWLQSSSGLLQSEQHEY